MGTVLKNMIIWLDPDSCLAEFLSARAPNFARTVLVGLSITL